MPDETVECIACGWQGREHETDTRHCPSCGGECMSLDAIYGPDGLHPDPVSTDTEAGPYLERRHAAR